MDKRIIFLLITIPVMVTANLNAQQIKEPVDFKVYMEWQEFDLLDWEDFKGYRPEQYDGDAGSLVKIKAVPYIVRKKIKYDVYALFDKTKSWALERSPQLLKHEQLHFDIAELYARKIRKKILQLSSKKKNDLKTYNHEIRKLLNESNEFDRLYDMETLHGSLTRKQKEWEHKVKQSLASLKGFARKENIIGKN